MKKLLLALAFAAVMTPLSAAKADVTIYPTYEAAWAACTDGHVAPYYTHVNGGPWQLSGYICVPHSGTAQ